MLPVSRLLSVGREVRRGFLNPVFYFIEKCTASYALSGRRQSVCLRKASQDAGAPRSKQRVYATRENIHLGAYAIREHIHPGAYAIREHTQPRNTQTRGHT